MTDKLNSLHRYVVLGKICLPLLCFWSGCELLDFRGGVSSWRSLIAVPLFIAAWFGSSLAVLQIGDGRIRYKRLFKWIVLSREEIIDARVEAAPIAGSLRLSRFLAPWGRLYFVLDEKSTIGASRKADYPILLYLSNLSTAGPDGYVRKGVPVTHGRLNKILLAALLGAVFSGLCYLIGGNNMPYEPAGPIRGQVFIKAAWELSRLLGNNTTVGVGSAIFAVLAVLRRHRSYAWIVAFLAAAGWVHLFLHLISR